MKRSEQIWQSVTNNMCLFGAKHPCALTLPEDVNILRQSMILLVESVAGIGNLLCFDIGLRDL
jgi:hypothetical protein